MNRPVEHAVVTSNVPPQEKEVQQYLTFLLGGEMFAMRIERIKEIIEFGDITKIPLMPAFISGVINLRGAVVPVIDLSQRFARSAAQISKRSCIVIIETGFSEINQDIGVIVDSVSEVLEIMGTNISDTPNFGAQLRTDFIEGMAKINNRFFIILDIDKVLSIEEMSELVQMTVQKLEH